MKIEHTLAICAPPERCFDLVRSVELNASSIMGHKTLRRPSEGLISISDEVAWSLKPLGISKQSVSRITLLDFPYTMVEEMIDGPFKSMRQEYHFKYIAGFTHHTQTIEVKTSLGFLGNMMNELVLSRYLGEYLKNRHYFLKDLAECDKWKTYLPKDQDIIYMAG